MMDKRIIRGPHHCKVCEEHFRKMRKEFPEEPKITEGCLKEFLGEEHDCNCSKCRAKKDSNSN